MVTAVIALLAGLVVLFWSAERFVTAAAVSARHFGMPAILVGMVVVGFGTSAPEMVVSAMAAADGNPGIALGNAYGSNITNIALILGLAALVSPLVVHASIVRRELPVLVLVTALAAAQLVDGDITRQDAMVLLAGFVLIMGWTFRQGLKQPAANNHGVAEGLQSEYPDMPMPRAVWWLLSGLVLLVASSRLLVWGAVTIAEALGVSSLVIGLTIIALGTSLPELASSLVAARKGEHDIAVGNIVGSNLFNTLAVVGIAGAIHPMEVEHQVVSRDLPVMAALTLSLFAFGYRASGPRRINRIEGGLLLSAYIAYMGWLLVFVF